MDKFINKITKQIYDTKQHQLEELTVILPSKRAGTFFKQALSDLSHIPLWMLKFILLKSGWKNFLALPL